MATKPEKERWERWLTLCKRHRITKPKRITIDLSFIQRQFKKIKKGFIPEAMKDKRVIYYTH